MSHICVLGVPNLSLFATLIIEFGTVPTVWYFLFFTSMASKLQSSLFAFIRALSINSRSTKNIKYYNMLFAHIKYGHANRVFPCSCHQLTFWSTPLFLRMEIGWALDPLAHRRFMKKKYIPARKAWKYKSKALNRRTTHNMMLQKNKDTRKNKDIQNTTHKTKDRAAQKPYNTRVNSCALE
jgi:hypothetical protein